MNSTAFVSSIAASRRDCSRGDLHPAADLPRGAYRIADSMANTTDDEPKPNKPRKKPGPDPEVLKIEGDEIEAFDKMVRYDPEAESPKAKKK